MSHDAAGEGGPHAFNFGCQISLERGDPGGSENLVIQDSELFAVPRMPFEMARETKRGPNIDSGKSADNCYTPALPVTGNLDQSNYVAARIIDKEDLLEGTFEFLLLLRGLVHDRDSISESGIRAQAFASWRNHSIVIAVPSLSEIFGSTPSSLRILVLSGTRRGMSS